MTFEHFKILNNQIMCIFSIIFVSKHILYSPWIIFVCFLLEVSARQSMNWKLLLTYY